MPGADFSEGAGAKAALEGQEIEVFKAGERTDNTGVKRVISVAVVAAIAASYDPAKHEAPLTLGHPADNKPAYGWVKSLRATPDGRLMMRVAQVDASFAEAVRTGAYKKRSVSLYPPGSSGNPLPSGWYLRHVGWLGAVPPAVQGLKDAKFSDAAETAGAYCFPF